MLVFLIFIGNRRVEESVQRVVVCLQLSVTSDHNLQHNPQQTTENRQLKTKKGTRPKPCALLHTPQFTSHAVITFIKQ